MGFIEEIKNGAIQGYLDGDILPSLTIAQAILESDWGRSAPGNMLFGIKWTENCGYDYQLLWTAEYINGKYVNVQAKFRKYDSYAESIEDHTKLLMIDRYEKVRQATEYITACTEVWKAHYATDPDYPKKLIKIIEENNLQKYDEEAKRIAEDDFEKMKRIIKMSKSITNPNDWVEGIKVAVSAAKADGDLGPLEIFEFLPALIVKIYNANKNTN